MKAGDETDVELVGATAAFGKTKSNQIWFVDLKDREAFTIRSIQFKE